MKKFLMVVVMMVGLTSVCFANLNVNNISFSNTGGNHTMNLNAQLNNPDNAEYQNIEVYIQFFDANNSPLHPITKTTLNFIKPNNSFKFTFACYVPDNAVNYKISYQAGNVIIPNYVYYQNQYVHQPITNGIIGAGASNNLVSNILSNVIVNALFR